MRQFIDKKYLTDEFLWENKNINGEELFTDSEINFLLQKASERINSILTIANFDELESLTPSAQEAIKLMTANQFLTYTLNGVNYLDIVKKISIGSINVESQVNSNYPDVPAEIFDIGTKAGLIDDEFVLSYEGDSTTSPQDPIFSSQFSTKEFVYQVGIIKTVLEEINLEDDPEYTLELFTKGKFFEYVDAISVGALSFNTGELISDMSLEGDASDFSIYKKSRVDQIINGISNALNGKIDIGDSPTTTQWTVKNASQDLFIRNALQQIRFLQTIVAELEQIIEAGGLTVELFKQSANTTITNTAIKINPDLHIASNRENVLSFTQKTGYKQFNVFNNGTFRISIEAPVQQGNATSVILNAYLLDDDTNEVLDTFSKTYDFNGTNDYSQQSARFSHKIANINGSTITQRNFSIRTNTTNAGNTIIVAAPTEVAVEMLTDIGSGTIATTDDVVNSSNANGTNATEALNALQQQIDKILNTTIPNLQAQIVEREVIVGGIAYQPTSPTYGTWEDLGLLEEGQAVIGGSSSDGEVKEHIHDFIQESNSIRLQSSPAGTENADSGDNFYSYVSAHQDNLLPINIGKTGGTYNKAYGLGVGVDIHIWKRIS